MPIVVKGAVWSSIRKEEKYIRVILMDQGYVDMQQCEAIIKYHGKTPKDAKDLLSNEKIKFQIIQVI